MMCQKRLACSGIVLTMFLCLFSVNAAEPAPKNDYLKGEHPDGKADGWSLGSAGAVGYLEPNTKSNILIDEVIPGSPADGKLKLRDVILGVVHPVVDGKIGTGKFTMNAFKALALAIEEAEKDENGGKLTLKIWRPETETYWWKNPTFKKAKPELRANVLKPIKAETIEVTLDLETLGSYSSTAPWNCDKTDLIVDRTAQRLLDGGFSGGIQRDLEYLGLLATGEDKYLPRIRNFVRGKLKKIESFDVFVGKNINSWSAGYENLLLTEYYLRTKDAEVLPAVRNYAKFLAEGASGVGTWGHGMADARENGIGGPAGGYGAMNVISLVIGTSLMLSQKCGVDDPLVDQVVDNCINFYRPYAYMGCIPYGDHQPKNKRFDINGKNSMAAVFFDVAGMKEESEYFARTALASHHRRETGHATYYFTTQWGALSASRLGPEATRAWVKKRRWFHELLRRPDFSSYYQPKVGHDTMKTGGWSNAGAQLLAHTVHRKALYISGKNGSDIEPVVGEDLESLIKANEYDYKQFSTDELLKALSHAGVVVKIKAAKELSIREDNVVDELMTMLESEDINERLGAMYGLRYAGRKSQKAVEALLSIVKNSKSIPMVLTAVDNLQKHDDDNGIGKSFPGRSEAYFEYVVNYDDSFDKLRRVEGKMADALFAVKALLSNKLNGPRPTIIAALKSMLQHPNGKTRTQATNAVNHLTKEEKEELWGPLYFTLINDAPSGVMFNREARVNSLRFLAHSHIEEAMDYGAWFTFDKMGYGRLKRLKNGMKSLAQYGSHMEDRYDDFERHNAELLEELKKKPTPELISINESVKDYAKEANISILEIERLELWDAAKDERVDDMMEFNDTIDKLYLPSLTIKAVTHTVSDVKSVVFELNGKKVFTSNKHPYFSSESNGNDLSGFDIPGGTHTLTATPYSDVDGKGVAGRSAMIQLHIIETEPVKYVVKELVATVVTAKNEVKTLKDGDLVDIKEISSLSVEALATKETKRVNFRVNGRTIINDKKAPFIASVDSESNFFDWPTTPGSYTITAIPHDKKFAESPHAAPVSINITVVESLPTGKVIGLQLVNASTDKGIQLLKNGDVIDKFLLPSFTVRAPISGDVESVVFELNGSKTFTDNAAAYFVAGNNGSDFNAWPLAVGSYTLKATPFSEDNGAGLAGESASVSFNVIDTTPPPLPGGQKSIDVGSTGSKALATYEDGTYLISASGADIWGKEDAFGFVYQDVEGDVEVTANILSIEESHAWAKAGVMVRESLDADSVQAMTIITPARGASFQRRTSTGGFSDHSTFKGVEAPEFVRVLRSGNLFTGYFSSDKNIWYPMGSADITMNLDVKVGLAVTSHDNSQETEAVISDYTVRDAAEAFAVTRFILVNADTSEDIREIHHNETINLAVDGENLSIRAEATDSSESVVIDLSGVKQVENFVPYTLKGDNRDGTYNSWSPSTGAYSLLATPYSDNYGEGESGDSLAIIINVINE